METFPLYGVLIFMETFHLYGDSSLWRLFLFTETLLYILETFPLGGDCTGTLLYGDFASLRGLYGDSSLWRLFLFTGALLYGDFSSLQELYGESSLWKRFLFTFPLLSQNRLRRESMTRRPTGQVCLSCIKLVPQLYACRQIQRILASYRVLFSTKAPTARLNIFVSFIVPQGEKDGTEESSTVQPCAERRKIPQVTP